MRLGNEEWLQVMTGRWDNIYEYNASGKELLFSIKLSLRGKSYVMCEEQRQKDTPKRMIERREREGER